MWRGWLSGAAIGLALSVVGCGGGDTSGTGGSGGSGGSSATGGSGGDTGTTSQVEGHSLGMDVTLVAGADGAYSFLTPSNTFVSYPASDIVGKPTLIVTFPGGFSPGNDPPTEILWGTMPEDMKVHFASTQTYADGPWDIVFVCYTGSTITQDMIDGKEAPPAAQMGDLASFVLKGDIKEGDPKNALGTIRLNVEGADASVALENRGYTDPNDATQVTAAFTNTILTIP